VGFVLIGDLFGCLAAGAVAARLVAGFVPVTDPTFLNALDYVPPWWLAAFVLPVTLLWAGLGRRKAPVILVVLFVGLVVLEDDWTVMRPVYDSSDPTAITVLAMNVRHYRAGRTQVVDAIKSVKPDVVLISENHVDRAAVAELQAALAPYSFRSGRSDEAAVASRLPILSATEVELPSRQPTLHHPNRIEEQDGHPHRSFMHAVVDFHGTPVNAISIRFIGGEPASSALSDEVAWARYLMEAQREEIAFFLDYLSRVKGPIVFGGDLNATPTAHLVRMLDAVASDAYMANHWIGLPTFPAKFPFMRLDYVFCMNGLVPIGAVRPNLGVSDHDPILARVGLAPQVALAGRS